MNKVWFFFSATYPFERLRAFMPMHFEENLLKRLRVSQSASPRRSRLHLPCHFHLNLHLLVFSCVSSIPFLSILFPFSFLAKKKRDSTV